MAVKKRKICNYYNYFSREWLNYRYYLNCTFPRLEFHAYVHTSTISATVVAISLSFCATISLSCCDVSLSPCNINWTAIFPIHFFIRRFTICTITNSIYITYYNVSECSMEKILNPAAHCRARLTSYKILFFVWNFHVTNRNFKPSKWCEHISEWPFIDDFMGL